VNGVKAVLERSDEIEVGNVLNKNLKKNKSPTVRGFQRITKAAIMVASATLKLNKSPRFRGLQSEVVLRTKAAIVVASANL
jgi:hypothetical protein